MSLFFTSLQAYLLPTLSASKIDFSIYVVLSNALRLSLIVLVPLITLLIVIKPLVVHALYSGEFVEALEILRWTLFGDFIRVAAWVFALFMLARADMLAYSFHEFLWSLVFVLMSLWLVPKGVQWVGFAYVVAYLLYFLLLLYRVISHFKVKILPSIIQYWMIGFTIIIFATVITWTDISVVWWKLSIVFVSIIFAWSLITPSEKTQIKKLLNLGAYN
jgi:O-antigen/teichoic acid export membrane protein